jgi:prepilin-type N-terminal cleavage/methylation domain-containing protein
MNSLETNKNPAWQGSGDVVQPKRPSGFHFRALRSRNTGFSLPELLIVIAVGLIITAMAVPSVSSTMDAYRTRGGVTSVAGLIQRCRVLAAKNNTSERIKFQVTGGLVQAYCKEIANQSAGILGSDPQITMSSQFSIPGLPTGPSQLTASSMWGANFAQVGVNTDPYFNSRGLPCSAPVAGGACTQISGYVYYFSYTSRSTRWAAVSISPAGRVQTWFWNGNAWGN